MYLVLLYIFFSLMVSEDFQFENEMCGREAGRTVGVLAFASL